MFELISDTVVTTDQIKKTILGYLNSLLAKGKDFPEILRLALPTTSMNLLAWLKTQTFEEKIYWYDKQADLEVAGVGKADIVSGSEITKYITVIQQILKYSSDKYSKCRYYGGFSFYKDTPNEDEWQTFGTHHFLLPRFEIVKENNSELFICNLLHPDDESIFQLARELEKIDFIESSLDSDMPAISESVKRPDKEQWDEMINSALRHIRDDQYEKIVLARKIEIDFLSKPDPFTILSVLRNTNHHTVSFYIQPQPNTVFIGTTPEILYRREGRELVSEAVAGTRPRGKNTQEDDALANELLTSEKELREHNYVAKSLKRNLERLCQILNSSGEVTVLKLSQIQHLYVPFNGLLKLEVSDAEILESLHPTPAVGGYPEKSVLPTLKETEPFNRGWYAAPVGWVAEDSATFAVALRCALINKNKLYLYSGAGIVEGSVPEKEWEELDNKICHYKKVLGVDGKSSEEPQ